MYNSIFSSKFRLAATIALLSLGTAEVNTLTAQTTYNYTGGMQTYVVPGGVTNIMVDASGAQG